MIFVIDIDDTISDTDSYSEYYISKFFKDNNLPYKFVKKISRYAESKFDWDIETAIKWYKQFGDEMMLQFPCKKYALETINKLFDKGHTIVLATARETDWHTDPVGLTKKWLKEKGVKYNKIYIGQSITKAQICLNEHADFFIDDDVKLCQSVKENCPNTRPLLMSTDFNSTIERPKGIDVISNLLDIYKYIP